MLFLKLQFVKIGFVKVKICEKFVFKRSKYVKIWFLYERLSHNVSKVWILRLKFVQICFS